MAGNNETNLRRAAVLVPLVLSKEGPAILLEVRSMSVWQPGEICFPGGHVEEGETAVLTALRETEEELGIPRSSVRVLEELEPELHMGRMLVFPVLAEIDPSAAEKAVLRQEEVDGVFALPLSWLLAHPPAVYDITDPESPALPEKLRQYQKNYKRSGKTVTTNYWEYGPYGIWGLTARILIRLRNRFLEEKAQEAAPPARPEEQP